MTTSFLIDSRTWLWMLDDSPRLGERTRAIVSQASISLLLSVASAWELSVKVGKGRLRGPLTTDAELRSALAVSGVTLLPIDLGDVVAVAALPPHHGDPFDRMIVAQARVRGIPVLSGDPSLARYDVEVISD